MKRFAAKLLCILFIITSVFCFSASGKAKETKTVRVGWYESPFNITDRFGRRSGYAYEYQQKIASYTDWEYEYVEASWPELLKMLIDGEIDLLSDVSYTEERAEQMLFSSYAMGAEEYYIFVALDNIGYTPNSYDWFNGRKVGVNEGSIQAVFLAEWEKKHGVSFETEYLTCTEKEALGMLQSGELDALVDMDGNCDLEIGYPAVKIGSSDFFFAVTNSRPDLLDELDIALSRIMDENQFYSRQLFAKYVSTVGANLFLTAEEREWLSGHGTIRVGYQDDYLPFCDADERTGETAA